MNAAEVRNELLAKKVIEGLESRNMQGYFVKTKEEALKTALSLIEEGSTVSWGGSATAAKIGLLKELTDGPYKEIYVKSTTSIEERDIYDRAAFSSDTFITSSNAITQDGVLVNIDGNANRVAAICYGPTQVIIVVGMNKVVATEQDAYQRARNIAAPINAQRFGGNKPCTKTGVCMDCKSPDTVCCQFLMTRYSKRKGRIKVILIDENLGF